MRVSRDDSCQAEVRFSIPWEAVLTTLTIRTSQEGGQGLRLEPVQRKRQRRRDLLQSRLGIAGRYESIHLRALVTGVRAERNSDALSGAQSCAALRSAASLLFTSVK